jgi:hypothetical protein
MCDIFLARVKYHDRVLIMSNAPASLVDIINVSYFSMMHYMYTHVYTSIVNIYNVIILLTYGYLNYIVMELINIVCNTILITTGSVINNRCAAPSEL